MYCLSQKKEGQFTTTFYIAYTKDYVMKTDNDIKEDVQVCEDGELRRRDDGEQRHKRLLEGRGGAKCGIQKPFSHSEVRLVTTSVLFALHRCASF